MTDPRDLDGLVERLLARGRDRETAAIVSDGAERYEIAVAPGDRWVVNSASVEWIGTPDEVEAYDWNYAQGARKRPDHFPPGWFHPALGLLWPHLLPLWGRPGDRYRPVRTIDGLHGPAEIVCEDMDSPMVGGESLGPWAHVMLNDEDQITMVEFPTQTWTLLDIND